MTWNYNREVVDECFNKWVKLGWAGTGEPFYGIVDPELLIVETTHAGRYEGAMSRHHRHERIELIPDHPREDGKHFFIGQNI